MRLRIHYIGDNRLREMRSRKARKRSLILLCYVEVLI